MSLKDEVKEVGFASGEMDFFGVAPASRLAGAPEGSRPNDILPEARSVISLGIKLGAGVRKANLTAYKSNPLAIYVYLHYGSPMPGRVLENNAYKVVRYLEKQKYPTIAIPCGGPSDRLRLHGCVSHRHAAVAAGIGQFGLNGMAITAEAGCMIRLITIITEAEIEPDPLYSGPPICLGESCMRCIDACPMKAFDHQEKVSLSMDHTDFSYLKFKKWRCVFGTYGKRRASMGRTDCTMPEEPSPEDFLRAVREEDPFQKLEGAPGPRCGQCLVNCPVGE